MTPRTRTTPGLTRARTLTVTAVAAALIGLGAGPAAASSEPPRHGPEWQPGPDHSTSEPGPDYEDFQPAPDDDAFEPGASPGTADLVDDTVAAKLGGLVGRLFG